MWLPENPTSCYRPGGPLIALACTACVALLISTGAFAQVPPNPDNPNDTLADALTPPPYGEPINLETAKKVMALITVPPGFSSRRTVRQIGNLLGRSWQEWPPAAVEKAAGGKTASEVR
jgi:hypothetical protein